MKKLIYILIITFIFFNSDPGTGKGEWWKLYFTSPSKKYVKLKPGNPEVALIDTIEKAEKYFYGAFFQISSPFIIKALINAKKRGIDVKLVTEEDYYNTRSITRLLDANISVSSDHRNGLMHNKFAIIDNKIVWTGSYNITKNGALRNNNNAIKIHSPELSEIYLSEFHEMFSKGIFGNRKDHGPFAEEGKKYHVKIINTDINAYFSPEDNIEKIILKRLKKAKKAIHFMAFSFTSDNIGEAIITKFKKGVKVYGIFEKMGAKSKHSEYIKMKIEGIPVKCNKNRFIIYRMHHKVIIIDEERVITGSFNFSKNANKRNDENILIIDNKKIAGKYLKEFHKLYR